MQPPIEINETPITDVMFETQGWEKIEDTISDTTFYYWILPLPKDNPDDEAPQLISSANDEWEELGLSKGEYVVELDGMNGLGHTESEEETEVLYRALTKRNIYEKF